MTVPFFTKRGENKMKQVIQVFDYKFIDDELEDNFNDFFTNFDLLALFTNEHRTGKISVSYVEARSVINPGGAYNKVLKDFHDKLSYAQGNKKYEQAIFQIIYGAKSFTTVMNRIKKLNRFIDNEINIEHSYNTWNIVFYDNSLL